MSVRAKLREISQASQLDPKQALVNAVGDLGDFEPFHNYVLVATYIRPEVTKGGIILSDRSQQEDRFQSKIGLVLKKGPLAFVDDGVAKFGDITVNEGDWVTYSASDGHEMFFVDANGRDGTPCRMLEDTKIKGRIADPAKIW